MELLDGKENYFRFNVPLDLRLRNEIKIVCWIETFYNLDDFAMEWDNWNNSREKTAIESQEEGLFDNICYKCNSAFKRGLGLSLAVYPMVCIVIVIFLWSSLKVP